LGLGRPPEDGSVEPACNDWLGPIAATSWPANSVIRYWRAQYKDDRRKGEITHGDLKRRWPDPVALPSEKVRGVRSGEVIFCAADVVSATPLAHSLARDDGKLRGVVLFSKSQDAEAFADPSVGSGWLRAAGGDRENKRATRARCRYASELASRGFRVLGIGSSAEMVEVALKRPVAADRDLTSFKHPRQLRAILCCGVLNDFLTDKDRERAARPVCRASEPGGV
jgi:hypothetical protein